MEAAEEKTDFNKTRPPPTYEAKKRPDADSLAPGVCETYEYRFLPISYDYIVGAVRQIPVYLA